MKLKLNLRRNTDVVCENIWIPNKDGNKEVSYERLKARHIEGQWTPLKLDGNLTETNCNHPMPPKGDIFK